MQLTDVWGRRPAEEAARSGGLPRQGEVAGSQEGVCLAAGPVGPGKRPPGPGEVAGPRARLAAVGEAGNIADKTLGWMSVRLQEDADDMSLPK